jgi:serine-type D-Ala-D-Ala carboxypeptidase (penicillin-binding protein 5/6)
MMRAVLCLLVLLCAAPPVAAEVLLPMRTQAPVAVVVDYDTGAVLMNKNGTQRIPTASMSKLGTLYMVFEALERGYIGLEDAFTVSPAARAMGGSRMFLEAGSRVRVEGLIRGVAVQSGNDAAVALAEALAGSEGAFVRAMNARMAALGLADTRFANASGWPDPGHYSTARDLARLAAAVIRDFPQYYGYFSERAFTHNNITQPNRNPLLYRDGLGADGMKTGHTQEAGYGLIGSGVDTDTGRRVIVVLSGLPDERTRADEAARLLDWGLRGFVNRRLFAAGQVVARAPVARGKADGVALVPTADVVVTLPRDGAAGVRAEARLVGPLVAPVAQGAEVATLHVTWDGGGTEVPLMARDAVARAGIVARMWGKAGALLGAQ